MAIYGTGLLSICLLLGLLIGRTIGATMGLEANVGGVGVAMLLLIVVAEKLRAVGFMATPTKNGILFWSSIYIPVVVAMAASQNVLGAITGGPAAIVAGTLSVVVCFGLVRVLSGPSEPMQDAAETQNERGG